MSQPTGTNIPLGAATLQRQWKLGPVLLRNGEDYDVQAFTCTATRRADGWRVWYSRCNEENGNKYTFGYLDFDPDFTLRHDTLLRRTDRPERDGLNLLGLPPHLQVVQPVHLNLPDGRERLYFWAHTATNDVKRYLAADSDDGINFPVQDWRRPVLYHPGDRAVPLEMLKQLGLWLYVRPAECPLDPGEPRATADMLMNDATNVYVLPDGTFELYSAEVMMCPDGPEPHQKDPVLRFIQRRTSDDGLHWSPPQRILIRDEQDSYDLQFYYLAVTFAARGRLGILGHYRSDPGTADLEFCTSRDGIHWQRQRLPGFPREKGVDGIYAPHDLVRDGDDYYLFYTADSYNHHGVPNPDAPPDMPRTCIRVATIPVDVLDSLLPT